MSKSILSNDRVCYICGSPLNIHKHHVFQAANRKNSEHWGCWVYLCAYHHNMSDHGVHFDRLLDVAIKRRTQAEFERLHGHEKFMEVFGKNWL